MLRNKIICIVALATTGLASPTGAFARGGGGGHGGGGFGFRGGGFRRRGVGSFGPYVCGDYPCYYSDDYEGGCLSGHSAAPDSLRLAPPSRRGL
jgi:hypothetical protein